MISCLLFWYCTYIILINHFLLLFSFYLGRTDFFNTFLQNFDSLILYHAFPRSRQPIFVKFKSIFIGLLVMRRWYWNLMFFILFLFFIFILFYGTFIQHYKGVIFVYRWYAYVFWILGFVADKWCICFIFSS